MITPDNVLTHLYRYLPLITDRFTELSPVTYSEIVAAGSGFNLVLDVDSTAAFTVGRSYPVPQITLYNPITAIVGSASTGYTLTTANPHSLTMPRMPQDATTFDLSSGWIDSIITGVPDLNTIFTRNGEPTIPSDVSLVEMRNGGYFELVAKTATQLTFALPDGYFYPCLCDVAHVASRLNVAIVPDADRAKQVYTAGTAAALWAFIIFGDRNSIPSDGQQAGVTLEGKQNIDNLMVSTQVNILVVWPRQAGQESARKQLNEAYGLVYNALNSAMFGAKLDGVYRIAPVGNGPSEITDLANYAHAYEYQSLQTIDVLTDGLRPDLINQSAPIRFIDGNLLVDCGETDPQSIRFDVVIDNEGA